MCENCDIKGDEYRVKSNYPISLNDCQSLCMEDDRCLGIDYGKGKRRGECYINIGQSKTAKKAETFDAWVWSSDCGTILYILNYQGSGNWFNLIFIM